MGRSPAIDMGDNAVCGVAPNNVDQRGFVRPVDGGSGSAICDIGAFESEAEPPSVINSLVGLVPMRETRSPDTTGCPAGAGFVAKSSLTARLRNNKTNSPALYDLMVEATNGNLLLNPADGGPGGVGVEAILAVPQVGQYSNGVLDHGESVDVSFVICLKDLSPLNFVDRRGLLCEPRNICPR